MILKLIILGGLVWLNTLIKNPIIAASTYAIIMLVFSLLFTQNIPQILQSTFLGFLFALLYFWLLNRFSGIIWWIILISGVLIGLV